MKTYALFPMLAIGFFAVACDSAVEPINDVPSESLTPAFAESQSTDLVTAGIIFTRPPSESKSLQPPDEDLLTRNGAQVLYRFQGFRGAVVRIPNQGLEGLRQSPRVAHVGVAGDDLMPTGDVTVGAPGPTLRKQPQCGNRANLGRGQDRRRGDRDRLRQPRP